MIMLNYTLLEYLYEHYNIIIYRQHRHADSICLTYNSNFHSKYFDTFYKQSLSFFKEENHDNLMIMSKQQ